MAGNMTDGDARMLAGKMILVSWGMIPVTVGMGELFPIMATSLHIAAVGEWALGMLCMVLYLRGVMLAGKDVLDPVMADIEYVDDTDDWYYGKNRKRRHPSYDDSIVGEPLYDIGLRRDDTMDRAMKPKERHASWLRHYADREPYESSDGDIITVKWSRMSDEDAVWVSMDGVDALYVTARSRMVSLSDITKDVYIVVDADDATIAYPKKCKKLVHIHATRKPVTTVEL